MFLLMLTSSRNSFITIVNYVFSRSLAWSLILMAQRSSVQEISRLAHRLDVFMILSSYTHLLRALHAASGARDGIRRSYEVKTLLSILVCVISLCKVWDSILHLFGVRGAISCPGSSQFKHRNRCKGSERVHGMAHTSDCMLDAHRLAYMVSWYLLVPEQNCHSASISVCAWL